jgi:hypothetical protein
LRHLAYLVEGGRRSGYGATATFVVEPVNQELTGTYRPIGNSRRFGEPLPGLTILLAVAFAVSALCTVAGLAVGWPAR